MPISLVPSSIRGALADPHWHRAMEDKYAALLANQTWNIVPRPFGCNVVTASGSGRISVGLMAHWSATWLDEFSGGSLSGLVWTMMRPSAQW